MTVLHVFVSFLETINGHKGAHVFGMISSTGIALIMQAFAHWSGFLRNMFAIKITPKYVCGVVVVSAYVP